MLICMLRLRIVLAVLVLLFGTACAENPPPPQLPKNSPVRELVISVRSSRDAERVHADTAVSDALRFTGFQTARDDSTYDAVATVHVERGEITIAGGLLTFRGPTTVKVTVTLSVRSMILEELSTQFVADESGVRASDLKELTATLTASARVKRFAATMLEERARQAKIAEQAREAKRRADEERERQAREDEALRWQDAKAESCRTPTSIDACNGVHRYLALYPHGEHADEARQLVKNAKEPIRSLHDDIAWGLLNEDACAEPKEEDACAPILAYLQRYPDGNHAKRARELVAVAEPAITKMRTAREAREERAARAAEAASASAGASGGGSYSGGRSSGSRGGSVHVSGYTRKDGTPVRPHTRRRPRR